MAVPGDFDQARAHAAVLTLLSRKNRPTAIVTISNMMPLGLLFAVREAGLKIPTDLSLVGIDDLELAGLLDPKPTAVVTAILEMAPAQSTNFSPNSTASKPKPPAGRSTPPPSLFGSRARVA